MGRAMPTCTLAKKGLMLLLLVVVSMGSLAEVVIAVHVHVSCLWRLVRIVVEIVRDLLDLSPPHIWNTESC